MAGAYRPLFLFRGSSFLKPTQMQKAEGVNGRDDEFTTVKKKREIYEWERPGKILNYTYFP